MDNLSVNPNLAEKRDLPYGERDFTRLDERDDEEFYATDRLVSHLDKTALATVERLIGSLVVEENPAVLDLMASWDSHLPESLSTSRVTGLGMNRNELDQNPRLDERIIHDLNRDPVLPFPDGAFDVVLNTVSVDYLVHPLEVFREAARVLKPGGLFLVTFSNRWFEPKVTKLWRETSEAERVILVEEWMDLTGAFQPVRTWVSKGLPRPQDDKYARLGIPSDPVFAVFADRKGGPSDRGFRPLPRSGDLGRLAPADWRARAGEVGRTLCCPHCGKRMNKWAVPQTPFTEWDSEYLYVCFNDLCSYHLGGYGEMGRQGNVGSTYRQMYNPDTGALLPLAVPSANTMKDGIID